MAVERLHKVMANAGIASRRECEEMIAAGRVSVNGKIVTEMGIKVDPQRDLIRLDDEPIKARVQPKPVYIMLYKPAGYLSVFDDERGRPGLEALVKMDTRLYPVGRLDADSEGLQLLTNDGELTLRLSHPRYEHTKTYLVLLDRIPGTDSLARFRRGIELEDGRTSPSEWRMLEKPPSVSPPADPAQAQGVWVQVTLREGRKRQIRRMAAAERLAVRRLIRIGMGPLRLDRKLRPGQSRPLTGAELRLLQEPASGRSSRPPRRSPSERDTGPANRRPSPERGSEPDRRPVPSDRGAGPGRPRPPADRAGESGRPRQSSDQSAGPGRPRPPADRTADPGRSRPPSDRGAGPGRPRPPVERTAEPGRSRPPSDRGAGPSRPRPPADRSVEPSRSRPPSDRGAGPSRPRPPADRSVEPGRSRPSSDRNTAPGRPRPPAGRGVEPRRSGSSPSRESGSGYSRPPSDRGSAEGHERSSSDRDRQPRRPSAGRGNAPNRQRKPYGPGPRRSEREAPETRQSSHDRHDRPEPSANGGGRPERSQSPLRFHKPSRPTAGKRPGGYERDGRRESPRSKTESGGPSDRRQGSEQTKRRKPRPGGPPKSRKP